MKIWVEDDSMYKNVLFVRSHRPDLGEISGQFISSDDNNFFFDDIEDRDIIEYIILNFDPIEVTSRSKLYELEI